MRRTLLAASLLVAVCRMAAAQAAPAAAPGPAAQPQPATVHVTAADASDTASATQAVAAAPASRPAQQQRLLDEADQLVALAQQLKTEVNKTSQYTLSLNTLRRADDIEKLAKSLQKQVARPDR
jgi:hypothetical protein